MPGVEVLPPALYRWRICRDNGWWSAFGKKWGRNGRKPGPAVHDDLCTVTDETGRTRHVFTAERPNQLWLIDITEHRTATQGKLYLCAVKDVFSNKIVGYLIDTRMKSSLAVNALNNAVAMRGMLPVASFIAIVDLNFEAGSSCAH